MREELLPREKELLENYFNIRIGSWKVRCPYFMNVRRLRWLPPVYVGKGLPEEIEREAAKIYRLQKRYLRYPEDALHTLMLSGLGIDCSGLVANVLGVKSLKQPSWWRGILAKLRPRTNISADMLTGKLNAKEVGLGEVKPGDLIRQGSRHLMLVEWVGGVRRKMKKLGYVESNTWPGWGVQRGEITVVKAGGTLDEQRWSDEKAKKRYLRADDRGIRRLMVYD